MLASTFARTALLGAVLFGALSVAAPAQSIGLSFGKHGGHKHFEVNIGHHAQPDRWEIVRERVWVPGCTRRVWQEALYETRYDPCGRTYRVCIRPAGYVTISEPGHYEWRERRVLRRGGGHRRICF